MENYSDKLKKILAASGWTQEILAAKLGVSFATVNSWTNGKSVPRDKAKEQVELLEAEILGRDAIDTKELADIKQIVLNKKYSVAKITKDKEVLRKLTTSLTYHSNGTEGSTMSESDVSAVIYDNAVLKNRSAIEQREAINHQSALDFLLDEMNEKGKDFSFSPELIKSVHLRLMNGIISDAGMYRTHNVRIRGAYIPLANYLKVPTLVEDWCKKVNGATNDTVELLATSHAQFEKIHPFSDGNGRTGRLLLFCLALKKGIVPPIIHKERRYAYYKYLELAQTREVFEPLEYFLAEEILATSKRIAE